MGKIEMKIKDGIEIIRIVPADKILKRLVDLYKTQPLAVAIVCDEVLDRSGALLGHVRKTAVNNKLEELISKNKRLTMSSKIELLINHLENIMAQGGVICIDKRGLINKLDELRPYMNLAEWVIKYYVRTIPNGDFLIEGQDEMEELITKIKEAQSGKD